MTDLMVRSGLNEMKTTLFGSDGDLADQLGRL